MGDERWNTGTRLKKVFQKNVFHRNPRVSAGFKRFGTPEHV
jgi:hypothetical protein